MKITCNFSSVPKYYNGQQRLKSSLEKYNEPYKLYTQEYEIGSPLHKENMYAFKPYTMKKLRDEGYTHVLWLDASMELISSLDSIFSEIEKEGYFFQDSGWLNNRWTTKKAKEYFGTDEGEMISSGVLGINFNSEIGNEFFNQWLKASDDGMFNGEYKDFRHDQSIASLIAYKLNMKITPNNTWWNYGKVPLHDKICVLADGIC